MNLAVCAILWAGGIQVNVGNLSQGQVIAFVNYMTQTLLSIVYVANLVVVFTKASASASRVNEVLHARTSITDAGNEMVKLPHASEAADVLALEFDQASFAFGEGAAAAVDGVTLGLPIGGTLCLIGGTGSGKSTMVSLVPRLYDTTLGAVRVMGKDVRAWPLEQLRQVVGIVPQRASLVTGTIRSNLQWRDAEASDEDLWQALEVAQAAEFVRKMSQGLDSPVEAGGKNFSGGQRQRLTIARALVGNPLILIMDDSASALDFKTDAALRRAVKHRSEEGRASGGLPLTTVIVSQRVSAVCAADMICVLSHGAVAGLGTHDELFETCELYREICLSQFKHDEAASAKGAC